MSTEILEKVQTDSVEPAQKENRSKRMWENSLGKLSGRALLLMFRDRRESVNPFNRELEDGTRLRDLMTREGKRHFRKAIRDSEGNALVVVHPYYELDHIEQDPERNQQIASYTESLTREVSEYRDRGDVIIVFEESYKKDELDSILTRMGAAKKGSEVFIVPTKNYEYGKGSTPEPENDVPLVDLALELQSRGLRSATVAGMQFAEAYWHGSDDTSVRYLGCAGYTLERLKEAGVKTSIAESVLD